MASFTTPSNDSGCRRLSFGLSSQESDNSNSDGVRLSFSVSSVQESDGNASEASEAPYNRSQPSPAQSAGNSSSSGVDENTKPGLRVESLTPPCPSDQQAAAVASVQTDSTSVLSTGTPSRPSDDGFSVVG